MALARLQVMLAGCPLRVPQPTAHDMEREFCFQFGLPAAPAVLEESRDLSDSRAFENSQRLGSQVAVLMNVGKDSVIVVWSQLPGVGISD